MALVYQAVFPVNSKKGINDLVEVIKVWVAGSPHRNTTMADLKEIGNDGFRFSRGHVSMESIRHNEGDDKMYGVRLVEKLGAIRTTEVVGSIDCEGYLVSVIHEYEAQKTGDVCAKMSKPRIVNDVVRELGGGMDGTILYTNPLPFDLKEDDVEFVAEIIRNQSDNRLPVIYVSRDNREQTTVYPQNIARLLAGMAHVLVEPSRKFSFTLNRLTNGRNIYNGAVGIHWPNGIRRIILPGAMPDIEQELYDSISQCALHGIVPQKASYDGILATQAARKLEQLKTGRDQDIARIKEECNKIAVSDEEKARQLKDLDGIITDADAEIKLLQQQNGILEKEKSELAVKLRILEQRLAQITNKKSDLGDILRAPSGMSELYGGEIKDMVVDALRLYLNQIPDQSRREDIIRAVINSNPQTGKHQNVIAMIDDACRQFMGKQYTERFGNLLRAVGFVVEHDTGHPVVYVPGHEGRKVSISSTPSDVRTRKNENTRLKRDLA